MKLWFYLSHIPWLTFAAALVVAALVVRVWHNRMRTVETLRAYFAGGEPRITPVITPKKFFDAGHELMQRKAGGKG